MDNDVIIVNEDELISQLMDLLDCAEAVYSLPELHENIDCTAFGVAYLYAMYIEFSNLVTMYNSLFHEELNLFIDVCNGYRAEDNQDFIDTTIDSAFDEVFTYEPNYTYDNNWYINKESLDYIAANIIENLTVFCRDLSDFKNVINEFSNTQAISGQAAYTLKTNFRSIQNEIINTFQGTAQIIITRVSMYWASYYENSLIVAEGSQFIYRRENMLSCANNVQNLADTFNTTHSPFITETEFLKTNTSNIYDYTGITSSLPQLSEGFASIVDRLGNLISVVDQNESDFASHKGAIENSIDILVNILEITRTNFQTTDTLCLEPSSFNNFLHITDNNNQVNAIREENEENNIDIIVNGINHAVVANRSCAADNLETAEQLRSERDFLEAVFIIVASIIGAIMTGGISAVVEALVFALAASDATFHAIDAYEHYENAIDASNGDLNPENNNPLREAIGDNSYETCEEILDLGSDLAINIPFGEGPVSQIVYIGSQLIIYTTDYVIELNDVDQDYVITEANSRFREASLNIIGNSITETENTISNVTGIEDAPSLVYEVSGSILDAQIDEITYTNPILNNDSYTQDDLRGLGVIMN